ncbi:hypothetical protein V6Z12_D10G118700 [Gossypium hirsutum]
MLLSVILYSQLGVTDGKLRWFSIRFSRSLLFDQPTRVFRFVRKGIQLSAIRMRLSVYH